MGKFTFAVPCLFGLEGLAGDELRRLNMEDVKVEDRRVLFTGDENALAKANICLRTGERIMIVLAQFEAKTFEELFQGVYHANLEDYIPKDGGLYLKRAPDLKKEAAMTRFYHERGQAAEVLDYYKDEHDWLLTSAVQGEDSTHYTDRPELLCKVLGQTLRALHDSDISDCPVPARTEEYLRMAEHGYRSGKFDRSLLGEDSPFRDAEQAWKFIAKHKDMLEQNVLLHGDYCLPNVILKDGEFSGLIDVDGGGVGDQLEGVLVAGDDHGTPPGGGVRHRDGADQVIGLPAVQLVHGDVHGGEDILQNGHLTGQFVGHAVAVGLVALVGQVAEGGGLAVEGDAQGLGLLLLQQFV